MNIFFGSYDVRWDSKGDRCAWGASLLFFVGIVLTNAFLASRAMTDFVPHSEYALKEAYGLSLILFVMPSLSAVSDSFIVAVVVLLVSSALAFRIISAIARNDSAWTRMTRYGLIFATTGLLFQICILVKGYEDWTFILVAWAILMMMYAKRREAKQ